MGRRSFVLAALAVAASGFTWLAACGAFGGDESTPPAVTDGASTDGADGQVEDAGPDVNGPGLADADASSPCPMGIGPAMRVVTLEGGRHICVDLTEVSADEYATFRTGPIDITAVNAKVPPECTTLNPNTLSPADTDGKLPRRNVSFCSAASYCAAQGKRLCGDATTGAAIAYGAPVDTNDPVTEWELACANGGPKANYPWGPQDFSAANGCETFSADPDASAARSVGAVPTCGPSDNDGPYDMIGNVWEWVSLHREVDGGSYTSVRGGAWDVPTPGSGCATRHALAGGPGLYAQGQADVGFRCCADPK
jgi:formylglycine-generating enzyme required for sulfatase activity